MCDRASLILIALVATSDLLSAQVAAPLAGERIRVFASGGTWEGTFVALDSATLRFMSRPGGSETAVPRRSVARLEVQRGRRRAVGKGAGIGFGIGAALGGVLAAVTADECEPGVDPGCMDIGIQVVGGAAVGGLLGAAAGAVIGAAAGQDAWVPVDLRTVRVGAIPTHRGIGIALAISF